MNQFLVLLLLTSGFGPSARAQFVGGTDTVTTPAFTWASDAGTGIWRPATGTIGIATTGVERVRINSVGVGIGTTNPTTRLQVQGASGATTGIFLHNSDYAVGTTGSGTVISTGASSGNTFTQIQAYNGGASTGGNLVLNAWQGNVGIGMTNPTNKLDVTGTVRATSFSVGPQIVTANCSNSAGNSCTATATCTGGKALLSGGFTTSWAAAQVMQSYPASTTSWTCLFYSASALGPHTCYAVCANIQ